MGFGRNAQNPGAVSFDLLSMEGTTHAPLQ